jgi:hypothetical protein
MSEGGEVKVFKITGEAAKAYSTGTKKKRVTRKRVGGDDESDATSNAPNNATSNATSKVQSNANPVINLSSIASIPPATTVNQMPTTISRQNAPVEPPRPVIHDGGDDKKIKVELKKKQTTKKVQLHPKKDGSQKVPLSKKSETRKKNRKVLLGVSSLHKRMTRAKKMQKTVKEMPLDKLKEELLKKKLIKSTSKAPESVLRQIAADAQIVEGKAL